MNPEATHDNAVLLTERHADAIVGVLSCFDRVIVNGSLRDCQYAGAMTARLFERDIPIFEFPHYANGFRDRLHDNARALAAKHGIRIEAVRRRTGRKEARVAQIIAERGDRPGLVHIFTAMESCTYFKPCHDPVSGKNTLRPMEGRCAHYYFYFIDELFGLCHLRVPTWVPFRLQFYCNGHNWLAGRLKREKIGFRQVDNAFVAIDDFSRAQQIADSLDPQVLQRRLDRWAELYCPVRSDFPSGWHWTLSQVEYATDVVFKTPDDLRPLYERIVREALLTVKADDVATFLGRNGLSPLSTAEGGSRYSVTVEGTRVRHQLGPVEIKMYDKFGHVLRLETSTIDVSFFKHHRKVIHRDGRDEMKNAPVRKTIHSLGVVRELLGASNRRYLQFVSTLPDDSVPHRDLDRVSRTVRDDGGRPFRGVNFFLDEDLAAVLAVLAGEFCITGLTVRRLRRKLSDWTASRISRTIQRFRRHGLLRKIGHTFKYYVTDLGRRVCTAALRLRDNALIPTLAQPAQA